MQYLPKLWIFTVLISIALSLNAQVDNALIGDWSISVEETINYIDGSRKVNYDSLNEQVQAEIKLNLAAQQFSFKNDNTFSVSAGDQTFQGTYTNTNGQLRFSYESGSIVEVDYFLMPNDQLRLKLVDDPASEALIHHIILKRTN